MTQRLWWWGLRRISTDFFASRFEYSAPFLENTSDFYHSNHGSREPYGTQTDTDTVNANRRA